MNESRKITLNAYSINDLRQNVTDFNLRHTIVEKLDAFPLIKDRFMKLNKMDIADEGDFISQYRNNKDYFFGVVLRMKYGEALQIFSGQLDGTEIKLEDIAATHDDKIEGSIADLFYFCMNKKHLILSSGFKHRRSMQTYVNWFLNYPDGGEPIAGFEPVIQSSPGVQLSDIKNIRIEEAYFDGISKYKTISQEIPKLKENLIRSFFTDIPSLRDIDMDSIIDAKIYLTVSGGKKKKDEEKEKALKALLKTITSEDVHILTKDGINISADTFELKKTVEIEKVSTMLLNEHELEQKMIAFLKELPK